jgi:hypothetical protein
MKVKPRGARFLAAKEGSANTVVFTVRNESDVDEDGPRRKSTDGASRQTKSSLVSFVPLRQKRSGSGSVKARLKSMRGLRGRQEGGADSIELGSSEFTSRNDMEKANSSWNGPTTRATVADFGFVSKPRASFERKVPAPGKLDSKLDAPLLGGSEIEVSDLLSPTRRKSSRKSSSAFEDDTLTAFEESVMMMPGANSGTKRAPSLVGGYDDNQGNNVVTGISQVGLGCRDPPSY